MSAQSDCSLESVQAVRQAYCHCVHKNKAREPPATASAGAVAELAAIRKVAKYISLEDIFQSIVLESLGPMNWEARKFLADLGRRISRVSGDDRETTFLFQRISVLLFRFNYVLLHNSLSWTTARNISLSILSELFQFFPTLVFRGLYIIIHIIIIIIITDLYSAFRSEDAEALDAAQED